MRSATVRGAGGAVPAGEALESPLATAAYRALVVVFNLFVVTVWLPRVTTIGSSDVGIGAVLLMAMVPLMLLSPKRGRVDRRAWSHRLVIFLGVGFVLFWGYLGVFRIDDPFRAGRLILSLGQGVILLYVVTEVLPLRALRPPLIISAVLIIGVALLGVYNYLGGQPTTLTIISFDRSAGLFKNPNQYGMIMAMSIPFAVTFMFRPRGKAFGVALFVSIFASLLLAASKTNLILGIAILLATIGYMMIASGRARWMLIALPAVMLSIALLGPPILGTVNPRAASILKETANEGVGENATVAERLNMWAFCVDVMRESPLFGQGTGQVIDTKRRRSGSTSERILYSHAHNVFFDLGRTTGVPGLLGGLLFILLSCAFAIGTLLRVLKLPARVVPHLPGHAIVVGAGFALLSYVLSNQMSDSFGPSTSVFFWLCLGILLRRDELLFARLPPPVPRRDDPQRSPVVAPRPASVSAAR